MGDRGFRAAAARIEAVALPAAVRWNPTVAARVHRGLVTQYPGIRVYRSSRRMLKDFPPPDVRALGIDPPRDRSRGYRAAVVALWVGALLLTAVLAALPRLAVAHQFEHWWPLLVVLAVVWQAGLVWLVARLMALQSPSAFGLRPR